MRITNRNFRFYGDINPHASVEAGEAIRADCRIERYNNEHGTPMIRITHLPTGQVAESNIDDEYSTLRLLAANLPDHHVCTRRAGGIMYLTRDGDHFLWTHDKPLAHLFTRSEAEQAAAERANDEAFVDPA